MDVAKKATYTLQKSIDNMLKLIVKCVNFKRTDHMKSILFFFFLAMTTPQLASTSAPDTVSILRVKGQPQDMLGKWFVSPTVQPRTGG